MPQLPVEEARGSLAFSATPRIGTETGPSDHASDPRVAACDERIPWVRYQDSRLSSSSLRIFPRGERDGVRSSFRIRGAVWIDGSCSEHGRHAGYGTR